jgi:type III secretion protein S
MISVQDLFEIAKEGLLLSVVLCLPIVGAVVLASLISALLQSFTKISEPALSVLPRILAGTAALIIAAPWIGARAAAFAQRAWSVIHAIHS